MFLYRNEESIDLETLRVINSLSLSFFSEKRYLIDKVVFPLKAGFVHGFRVSPLEIVGIY